MSPWQSFFRRWRVAPWPLLWGVVMWVLLWGSLSWANIIGGLVFAYVVLAVFPLPRVHFRLTVRPWPLVVLVARFLFDVVKASLEVAWLVVRPGPPARGRVMDMELAGDDVLLQTLVAEMVCLVPGSIVIDLDARNRVLTIHALNVTNRAEAEAFRHMVRAQEARVLRALHPNAEELLHPRRRREAEERLRAHDEERLARQEARRAHHQQLDAGEEEQP